jgi:hypothetical protein
MDMDIKSIAAGIAIGAAGALGANVLADKPLVVKQLDGHLDATHMVAVDTLADSWGCTGKAVSMTFLAQDEGGWAYHVGCPTLAPVGLPK